MLPSPSVHTDRNMDLDVRLEEIKLDSGGYDGDVYYGVGRRLWWAHDHGPVLLDWVFRADSMEDAERAVAHEYTKATIRKVSSTDES